MEVSFATETGGTVARECASMRTSFYMPGDVWDHIQPICLSTLMPSEIGHFLRLRSVSKAWFSAVNQFVLDAVQADSPREPANDDGFRCLSDSEQTRCANSIVQSWIVLAAVCAASQRDEYGKLARSDTDCRMFVYTAAVNLCGKSCINIWFRPITRAFVRDKWSGSGWRERDKEPCAAALEFRREWCKAVSRRIAQALQDTRGLRATVTRLPRESRLKSLPQDLVDNHIARHVNKFCPDSLLKVVWMGVNPLRWQNASTPPKFSCIHPAGEGQDDEKNGM